MTWWHNCSPTRSIKFDCSLSRLDRIDPDASNYQFGYSMTVWIIIHWTRAFHVWCSTWCILSPIGLRWKRVSRRRKDMMGDQIFHFLFLLSSPNRVERRVTERSPITTTRRAAVTSVRSTCSMRAPPTAGTASSPRSPCSPSGPKLTPSSSSTRRGSCRDPGWTDVEIMLRRHHYQHRRRRLGTSWKAGSPDVHEYPFGHKFLFMSILKRLDNKKKQPYLPFLESVFLVNVRARDRTAGSLLFTDSSIHSLLCEFSEGRLRGEH